MAKVVYESNKATVGDGVRVTRVADGGQTLEIMVDTKTERFSRIILADDTETAQPLAVGDPIESVGTSMTAGLSYAPSVAKVLRDHIAFINDDRVGIGPDPVARELYLWDVIKSMVSARDG